MQKTSQQKYVYPFDDKKFLDNFNSYNKQIEESIKKQIDESIEKIGQNNNYKKLDLNLADVNKKKSKNLVTAPKNVDIDKALKNYEAYIKNPNVKYSFIKIYEKELEEILNKIKENNAKIKTALSKNTNSSSSCL